MVYGNHIYIPGIHCRQGYAADGADIALDVSNLRNGGNVGPHFQRNRQMDRRTALINVERQILETWIQRYGADLLRRICDGSIFEGQKYVPMGLFRKTI